MTNRIVLPEVQGDAAPEGECCGLCKFWMLPPDPLVNPAGTCRRNPPLIVGVMRQNLAGQPSLGAESFFPGTNPDNWCGEFQR